MYKVFVNPGHSLNCKPDSGCVYNGIKEAEICASIASLLAKELKNNGILVEIFQQQGNMNIAKNQLNEVPKIANLSKANIFVSIHVNGITNETAKGTEVWYSKNSINGQKLAKCLNGTLVQKYDNYEFVNRGAKEDIRGLCVLKQTIMPAALVEVGFISNKTEADFIKNNQNEIAMRLCKGICNYFGIDYSKEKKTKPSFKLLCNENNLYDLYVNDTLVLSNNRLTTCLDYISMKYGV